jgi:hypothetical protein
MQELILNQMQLTILMVQQIKIKTKMDGRLKMLELLEEVNLALV